jgi:hypothetical protein
VLLKNEINLGDEKSDSGMESGSALLREQKPQNRKIFSFFVSRPPAPVS